MKNWIFLAFLITLSGCTQADVNQEISETTHCQVVEKTINLPELQQYFHIDVFPERSPLIVVVDHYVSGCLELNKFGKSISIKSGNDDKKQRVEDT